ncbi:MAG: nitrous oxide reductase accessory protein NosL [Methanoregulaceae archaeon]|nr:nitrous oxide reductase accessory protein NosL [Methanoregulaceae archaeon]
MMDQARRDCLRTLAAWASMAAIPAWLAPGFLAATEGPVLKKTDRCPVCGMFVYKYSKWVARIVFRDGSAYFYDGAKDMFKHIFNVPKYTPGKSAEAITDIHVTDYYEVELIQARSAFYVIGSDVLGPMGHELLPLKDQRSAQEFLQDHKGKSILRFQDVTEDVIKSLDRRS